MIKIITLCVLFVATYAQNHHDFAPQSQTQMQTITNNNWCSYSAQDLIQTYKINYIARLSDGMDKQYACIRNLREDFDAIKDRVIAIEVVDYASERFINVEDAYFVVNSSLQSPCSKYAKVAFAQKEDANKFINRYGGDIRDFEFTFYMAQRDIEIDKEYFAPRDKRNVQRGQRAYEMMCNKIEPLDYDSIQELKKMILENNLCKQVDSANLQHISSYLWHIKRLDLEGLSQSEKIAVPQEVKCPVCGMFVAKYPKWVGKITLHDGKAYYFDGAKDLFKYYFDPQSFTKGVTPQDFEKIEVTNYYTLEPIVAQDAFYVIGSNVYGPMGHELIPFTTKEEAANFKKTRFGEKIVTFEEITKEEVYALDHR
ncbi:MAG: nitrous oxide reductase accessory protein NosL [Campylobacterota bacterium]